MQSGVYARGTTFAGKGEFVGTIGVRDVQAGWDQVSFASMRAWSRKKAGPPLPSMMISTTEREPRDVETAVMFPGASLFT